MSRSREARFLRRLAERRAATATGNKFGAADPRQIPDRRQEERRDPSLTPAQIEARMRELGISGDRRSGQRRSRGERRSA